MTLKGKTFDGVADLPRACRWSDARRNAWALEQTERYRVVAFDNGEPVIAEELTERLTLRLSEDARPLAHMLLRLQPEDRVALLRAFDQAGNLINVFDPV